MTAIDQLNKRQLSDIQKHITGSGSDYARIPIATYRERIKAMAEREVEEAIEYLRIVAPSPRRKA